MLKAATKVGVFAVAVYYTTEIGVWKDNETTVALYREWKEAASPHLKRAEEALPFQLPAVPKTDNLSQLGVHYWNSGVKATFAFLVDLPDRAVGWGKSAYDSAIEFANSPSGPSEPSDSK